MCQTELCLCLIVTISRDDCQNIPLVMHIHKVDMAVTLRFIAIPIKNTLGKCVYIQISDDSCDAYVSEFPNLNEGNLID